MPPAAPMSIVVPQARQNYRLAAISPSSTTFDVVLPATAPSQPPSSGLYIPVHKRVDWRSPYLPLKPKAYSRNELLALSSSFCHRHILVELKRTCPEIVKPQETKSWNTFKQFNKPSDALIENKPFGAPRQEMMTAMAEKAPPKLVANAPCTATPRKQKQSGYKKRENNIKVLLSVVDRANWRANDMNGRTMPMPLPRAF